MSKRAQKPSKVIELERGEKEVKRYGRVNEPQPEPLVPPCPSHLDTGAKKFYKRYTKMLDRVGLMTEVDGDSFSLLCQMFSEFEQLNKALAKCEDRLLQYKHTVDGAGNEHVEAKVNPLLVQRRLLYQNIRPYLGEFGLTPRGRAGLVVGTAEKKNEMEKHVD